MIQKTIAMLTAFLSAGLCIAAGPVQDAINAAGPGAVVEIPPGLYRETIQIPADTFVVATDPDNTVLDGGGAHAVVEAGANAAIVGFTIRNGKSAVYNRGHFIGVFECRIENFTEYGIRIDGGSAAILHNEVTGAHNATGIGCRGSNPYVAHNLIQSNAVGLYAAMNLIPVVEHNVFRGNDLAIQVEENAQILSHANIFDGNGQTFAGQEPAATDMVRPATEEELERLRGQKIDGYRELMKRVREEAAAMQPRIIYDLTPTAGRFGLICSFPWSVFHVASITRDTQIETYDAYDRTTDKDLNAHAGIMHGHPAVMVSNPELLEKEHDRYVSEKIFIHPASLAYQPDGSYVFNRTTNLARIEVRAPAGFVIVRAPADATLTVENGRHVARLLANGLTTLQVVMRPGTVAP